MAGTAERLTMGDGAEIGVYHVPAAGERRGGLVVIQGLLGVTAPLRAIADGYAGEGYEVLLPSLFDREQPGFAAGDDAAGVRRGIELARQLHPFEQSVADVQTCIDALAPRGPVFVVGYGYGGSVAWIAAARATGLAAASSYYGSQVPLSDERPRVPTVAHFGRHDPGIPVESVAQLVARRPAKTEIHLYDAGHDFGTAARAGHDPESAALARDRTLALFRAHGG